MIDWKEVMRRSSGKNLPPPRRVEKTEDEWRALLSPDVFTVTRRAGTERPFSSSMCGLFEPGRYHCACCDTLLFDADEKFDSGTGWPSFTQPASEDAIAYLGDDAHGMRRVETICAVCDAHLGHVFPDGPAPSRLRYCMNALSLTKHTA